MILLSVEVLRRFLCATCSLLMRHLCERNRGTHNNWHIGFEFDHIVGDNCETRMNTSQQTKSDDSLKIYWDISLYLAYSLTAIAISSENVSGKICLDNLLCLGGALKTFYVKSICCFQKYWVVTIQLLAYETDWNKALLLKDFLHLCDGRAIFQ